MASKFFRGFSKVFKGPNNRDGFKRPTKYATIGGVKPKAKVSDATKKFKAKVEATKKAIKKGTDDFKKENPNRSITDKQIKTVQREQAEKSNKKTRKEFLREKKAFGGLLGKKKKSVKPKKPNPDSIKQKILPKKKKDRLDELRKDLGLKEGGSALKPVDKEKNPGLSKLPTQVRNKMGYMKKGGAVRGLGGTPNRMTPEGAKKAKEKILMDRFKQKRKEQSDKPKIPLGGGVRGSDKGSDIYSRIKQRERLKKIRKKFGGGRR